MTDSKAMCSDGTRGGEELGEVEEEKQSKDIYASKLYFQYKEENVVSRLSKL